MKTKKSITSVKVPIKFATTPAVKEKKIDKAGLKAAKEKDQPTAAVKKIVKPSAPKKALA